MVEFRDRNGAPISDLNVTARFQHPFDASQDRQTTLASDGLDYEGIATPVAPGRWTLVIEASRGAERLFRSENKLAVADTGSELGVGLGGSAGPLAFRPPPGGRRGGDGSRRRRRLLRRLHRHDREGPAQRGRHSRGAGESGESSALRSSGMKARSIRRSFSIGSRRSAIPPIRSPPRPSTASRSKPKSACCAASESPPSAQ